MVLKVSADTTKKRINSLTMELMEARNTLDVKKKVWLVYTYFLIIWEYYAFSRCLCTLCVFCVQELSVLQVNSEGQLKVLETDLQAAKATVTSLKDRNKDLGKISQQQQIEHCHM